MKRLLIYLGGGIILLMILVSIFAPWIAIQDPMVMNLEKQFLPPSFEHPFGLDQNGSDVFSHVVYGTRVSLFVAVMVVGISLIIGLVAGSIAGFFGGLYDQILMRIVDTVYAFPGFLLAIAMVSVMGPSIKNLIIAMIVTGWAGYARLVRGEFLHIKVKDYVSAVRALGAKPARQIIVHIWPNLVGPLVVQASFAMAGTIISESALSFLGLGAPSSTPTWGALLNAGRKVLLEAPHISIFSGTAIVLLVLGFNFFGDGLRDILDPKKY